MKIIEEYKKSKEKKTTKMGKISRLGIVSSKDWFKGIKIPSTLLKACPYVVGSWSDFHDGKKSNIEGKQTIAMCANYCDALKILSERKKEK